MFRLKPNYPIAINFDDQSISAIQLKENKNGLMVREWWYKQLEDDFEDVSVKRDELVNVLKEMIKNRKFIGRRAIILIPTRNTTSFPIRFKVSETESVESAIVRESLERITIPVNEAVIDYSSIAKISNEGGDQYNAAVITAKKDLIKQYIIILEQAGLSVEAIDYGLLSLIRLHQYLYNSIHDSAILCHIGYRESLLSIIGNDSILAQRYITWGIQPIIAKLQQNLGLPEDGKAAKTLLRKYGLGYGNRQNYMDATDTTMENDFDSRIRLTYQIISPYINKLIHEFQKMIAFFRSEEHNTSIKNIYIYGQGTIIHRLDQFFESSLNINTELINPLKETSFSDNGIQPDVFEDIPLTLALGLGMRRVKWL